MHFHYISLNKSKGTSLQEIHANTMSSVIVDTKGIDNDIDVHLWDVGHRWNKPKLDVMIFE